MSYVLLADCCEVMAAFENKTGDPVKLLEQSPLGKMINLARKNATLNGEPIKVGVTHHVLDTSAHTLARKNLISYKKEAFLDFLVRLFSRLDSVDLVVYDKTHENSDKIFDLCGDNYCDGDYDDVAVLEGAKRFARKGHKVVIVTEDQGLHGYANDESLQAVRMREVLELLTASVLVAA